MQKALAPMQGSMRILHVSVCATAGTFMPRLFRYEASTVTGVPQINADVNGKGYHTCTSWCLTYWLLSICAQTCGKRDRLSARTCTPEAGATMICCG